MISKSKAKRYRACAELLPPPGNEVVVECLDELERLQAENEWLRGQWQTIRTIFEEPVSVQPDEVLRVYPDGRAEAIKKEDIR